MVVVVVVAAAAVVVVVVVIAVVVVVVVAVVVVVVIAAVLVIYHSYIAPYSCKSMCFSVSSYFICCTDTHNTYIFNRSLVIPFRQFVPSPTHFLLFS